MATALQAVWKRRVLPPVVYGLLRLLDASWRYRESGREHLEACLASGRPTVLAFLHGRIFLLLRRVSRPRNGRYLSMCSKSLDGEAMAWVERRMGLTVIRGSTGSGGLDAIVEMIRYVREHPGIGACLAVDGSRGPRETVKPGVVALAQRTGGRILPVSAAARPAHVFRGSWDHTVLPYPFARVRLDFDRPIDVPRRLDAVGAERIRARLEERLLTRDRELNKNMHE